MVAAGGKQKARAWAPLVALVFAAALAGCEVADDVGVPGPDAAPPVRSSTPRPTLPPPTQDAAIAAETAKNTTEVQRLLGEPSKNELMAALTGIGFRQTTQGTAEGPYTVRIACAGTPGVLLTVTQPDRRDGTRLTLDVKCGRPVDAAVKLGSGQTMVQIAPNSTESAPAAAVGFRLERRPPG